MRASLVAYKALADLMARSSFLIVTVLAARRLTGDGFGLFALGTTLGWMAALASDAGMQVHMARAVARSPENGGAVLARWLPVRAAAAAALGAGILTLLAVTGIAGRSGWAMAMLLVAYLASGVAEFLYFFFRGLGRTDLESSLLIGHRVAALVLASATLWLVPSLTALAAALAIPACMTLAVALVQARSLSRAPGTEPAPVDRHRYAWSARGLWDEWRSSVLPIGAASVFAALYFRIDIVLLEWWQGAAAVGHYNAVFRIVEGLRLFPAAVLAVALPNLFRAGDAQPLRRVAASVTASGIGLAVVLWTIAPWLVPIVYGSAFAGAVPAFRILLAAFPLMSLNYALTHQLIGWDRHREYAAICAAALAFNVALNAILIPAYSTVGAAWSTLATEALLTGACLAILASYSRGRSGQVPAALAEVAK